MHIEILFYFTSIYLVIQLLCGREYVVGRKNADILFTDDPSISRKHAALSVQYTEGQMVCFCNQSKTTDDRLFSFHQNI